MPAAGLKVFANQFARSTLAPYRLVRWEMKRRGLLKRQARMIAEYLAQPGPKKLHIGCGHNKPAGWLNTDITDHADVCFLDATARFPMPDNSFDYIFSEHMIEHVPYEAGHAMLKECLRVLKPGGKVRIATPNLKNILGLYNDQPTPIQRDYIKWSIDRHAHARGIYTATHVINTFMTSWGHTFVYDVPALTRSMTDAGFVNVREYPPEQSDDPTYHGIEMHAREIGSAAMNELETMVLEGTKPAA